ncbi:MAG: Rieske (2Fe-2S) protein [Candidatus Kapabacteria bacterium]|nr:Rieske (2Fe-2S) protein [Candidatus Kapabacteria bacterium]MCS7169202.1 Rieske (2Fe-2S) protein [Candidatus Kapabacteria bacterium]MDW7996507.1 Rieske 2Fe-2S domain-containing protein [Bacteroidota bacterium]MDW8226045.1 Rieske 2Fe-2S domain-containing protein [Bacteroidota bacterium]
MCKEISPERRQFLWKAAVTLGAGVCLPVVLSWLPGCSSETKQPTEPSGTVELDLSAVPELQQVGGAAKRRFAPYNNEREVLIIRLGQTEFVAFSVVCTHMGCDVNYPTGDVIPCPCHGARFAVRDGRVLQGPAERPLRRFPCQYDAARNVLLITF